ncbi:MAG: hypothetical protein WEA56_09665 [Balneolaceae bacterium]
MNKVWNPQQKMAVEQMLSCSFIGSKTKIISELSKFLEQTGAGEIMVASYVYDHEERLKSHRLFAELMEDVTL